MNRKHTNIGLCLSRRGADRRDEHAGRRGAGCRLEGAHGLGYCHLRGVAAYEQRHFGQRRRRHPAGDEQKFQCAGRGSGRRLPNRHRRPDHPAITAPHRHEERREPPFSGFPPLFHRPGTGRGHRPAAGSRLRPHTERQAVETDPSRTSCPLPKRTKGHLPLRSGRITARGTPFLR